MAGFSLFYIHLKKILLFKAWQIFCMDSKDKRPEVSFQKA